jgi:hypothetical protein
MGLGAAMLFSDASSTDSQPFHALPKPERTRRADRSEASERLTSSSSFRAAYSTLVRRPMTASDRSACMEKLWLRWGEVDPVGMLAFLENKQVWPDHFSSGLKLSGRPDLLLDFALRHGHFWTLRNLNDSDPLVVTRLLAAIPEKDRGENIVELSKEIDRKLGRLGIEMKQPSPAYLRGVAETLIEQGRIDEFLDAFGRIEDPEDRNDLAKKFGDELGDEKPGDEVLSLVLRLPEPYRTEAAYPLMRSEGGMAMQFTDAREARKRQIEGFARAGFVEAAAHGVSGLFGEESAPSRGGEVAEWIANFPSDGSWKPITEEIFRSWSSADREGMIRQICALPDDAVREILAVEAAEATIGNFAQPFDEKEQMIYDRLLGLFTDPHARKRFEERFTPSLADGFEETENSDSSAPDEDPFGPGKDPFLEE